MNDKDFVLVSQGIEIYRTKSQENAVNMVKECNDEYFDYLQKCYDNYERPADNYVDLEIEYSNEKEKDKEIERLKIDYQQANEILAELKQRLEDIDYFIKQRCKEDISETESAILQSIALISNGTIKVVRDE